MIRKKIGKGFWQTGYGRGFHKIAVIYLINGFCYANSKKNWKTDFKQLEGELKGYVRINAAKNNVTGKYLFVQCYDHGDTHKPFEE